MNRLIPRALKAFLATALLATTAQSQVHPNLARGFEPERLYSVLGIDQIAPFNGTLSLTIPLGATYPTGGDLAYGFTLVYSANAWQWETQCVSGAPRHSP